MDIYVATAIFIGCMLAILGGGRALTKAAAQIAAHTGLGHVFIGTFLLAATTSLPEVATEAAAASMGLADIALGDLFGSNIFNMTIIAVSGLAVGCGSLLAVASKTHIITGTFGMLLSAIAALSILTRPNIGFLGVGIGVWVIVGVYALGFRFLREKSGDDPIVSEGKVERAVSPRRVWGQYFGAAAVVIIAAIFLSKAADVIAETTGLGGTFIGTTLVAATTSFPELVTTMAAVRLRAVDLALANVLGSNIFNMTILLVSDLFFRGGYILSVGSQTHAITALVGLILSGLVVLLLSTPVTRRFGRLSLEAVILIGVYLVGTLLVFLHRNP